MQAFGYVSLARSDGVSASSSANPALPPRIRFLDILPGTDNEDIKCQHRHVTVDSTSEYEALSYTLGSPERIHRV